MAYRFPMKPRLACPRCHGEVNKSGTDTIACVDCKGTYFAPFGIVDFIGAEQDEPSSAKYNVAFNVEILYRTSVDLETRVRYFNTRFRHDAGCGVDVDSLNVGSHAVLEVGCGTMEPLLPVGSRYLEHQAVWGVDISLPLLLRARQIAPRVFLARANAESLPFRQGTFDLVWARHMLYHAERPESVIQECHRCLTIDGVFALSTNSSTNKEEMHGFHRRLMRAHGLTGVGVERGSERFPAEKASAIVGQHFRHVSDFPYAGRFEFKEAAEFLDYYASTTYFKLAVKSGSVSREALLESASDMLREYPVLSMSNNGTLVFGSQSTDRLGVLGDG